jgi:hypothetical protein
MASTLRSIDEALKLLDELSSAQKTLHAMNQELLRAVVDSRKDVPALRERVVAQQARVQAMTERMIQALRDS